MDIVTSDNRRVLDVGSNGDVHALYSTAVANLEPQEKRLDLALTFLRDLTCPSKDAIETARQLNLIRDKLSLVAPDGVVYDIENPSSIAPWTGKLSPVVTSCGNLFTTPDGKDMIFELVSILAYAGAVGVSVQPS